jgi:GntR family transcriptional regulator
LRKRLRRSPQATEPVATTAQPPVSTGGGADGTLPDATIDRASPVPFYFQLAETLEEEIVSGRWEPGTRIASENELCAHYGLSRTTVRQALARLGQEGLVRRDRGRGTYVAESRPRSWLIQSTEGFFHDEPLRGVREVTSRMLRIEQTRLPAWASDSLGLPSGSPGVIVERVRSVDGVVALYGVNCLPPFTADAVLGLDPNQSLYQRLIETLGVDIVGGSRSLEAVTAGAKLARLLEVEPGAALAYIESTTWDQDERPIDCYRAWLRTDRMRVEIRVSTDRGTDAQLPYLVSQILR